METEMEKEKLLGGNRQYQNNPHLRISQKQPTKGKKKPIKIKYISSPMMVRANNASEFRAIVQELTGRNSNVTEELYDDVHDDHESPNQTTTISELDHDDHDHQLIWPQFPAHDHHHPQGSDEHHDVEEKLFSSPNNICFLAQNDEFGQFWRSEVSESFNGFQSSSCVFVGQN